MLNSKISTLFIAFALIIGTSINAQVSQINLEQTPGEFTTKQVTLAPGDYQFEIANNGVDHEVGFVLAPKGKTDAANHIKAAYVTETVKDGATSKSNVVSLAAGEYVYFCPMNPTEQYDLTVKNSIKKISLEQTVGAFTTESLTLDAGDYQFEIANNGVDHEVGFVLAPKGKTDAANHIKDAYVTKTVKDGSNSLSKIVTLAAGEYVYFCPMNPTKEYPLTVK